MPMLTHRSQRDTYTDRKQRHKDRRTDRLNDGGGVDWMADLITYSSQIAERRPTS